MKGLIKYLNLSVIEKAYFFIPTETVKEWFKLVCIRIFEMQFSLHFNGNEMVPLLNWYLAA